MSNTKQNEAGAFLSGVGCLCAVPDIYNHFGSDRGDCILVVDQTNEGTFQILQLFRKVNAWLCFS